MSRKLRIGTRKSRLALIQTDIVISLLQKSVPGIDIETVHISTIGDKINNKPLDQIGERGLFTKEIETALLDCKIDAAVHSLKDLESTLPEGLILGAVPERIDPRDVLVTGTYNSIGELPEDAAILTGSLRRKAQLKGISKRFNIGTIRGNIETRLRKFRESDADAIVMAGAGLIRSAFEDEIKYYIPEDIMVPSAGQGAIGVEIRSDDSYVKDTMARINDLSISTIISGERAFLRELHGGCLIPVACNGKINGNVLELTGYLADLEGETSVTESITGNLDGSERLGRELAIKVLSSGGDKILEKLRN